MYHKTEASLNQAHTQIADLSATGGKWKGNKWELYRQKDIEPNTFDGKGENWTKWKEEIEDYADVVHEGLKHALHNALKASECVT